MNLLHKVGVLFHANDRLSHSLDKFGKSFTDLDAKQRQFEKHQAEMGRNATRAGNQMARANAEAGRSFDKLAASEMRNINAMEAAQLKYGKSLDALAKKRAAQSNMDERFATKYAAQMKRYKQMEYDAYLNSLSIENARDRAIENARNAHLKKMESLNEAHIAKTKVTNAQLDTARRDQAVVTRRGLRAPLTTSDLAAREAYGETLRRDIRTLEASAAHAVATAVLPHDAMADPVSAAAIRGQIAAQHQREISNLQQKLALNKMEIEDHFKLVKLNADILRLEEEQRLATERRQIAMLEAVVQQEGAEKRLNDLYDQRAAAQKQREHVRLGQLDREIAQQVTLHENAIRAQTEQYAVEDAAHKRTEAALERQHQQRKLLLADQERQNIATKINAQLVEMQAEAEGAVAARRTAILAREGRIRTVASGMAGGMATGAGQIGTGLMGLGALGWAGNHLVHAAAENQGLDVAIQNNIYGQKDGRGRLWSQRMIDAVESNGGHLSNGMYLSSISQKHLITEGLGAQVRPEEVLKSMGKVAQAERYFQNRLGGRAPKNITRDLWTILEQTQSLNEKDIGSTLDSVVKDSNISSRASVANTAGFLQNAAPAMMKARMNIKDLSPIAFFLAGNPSGRSVGTYTNAVLTSIAKGGDNVPARLRINDMMKKGYFSGFEGKESLTRAGKKTMSAVDAAHPILAGMNALEPLLRIRSYALHEAGISEADFLKNKFSNKQNTKFTAIANEIIGARQGQRLLNVLLSPKEENVRLYDREKFRRAPGLGGSSKSQEMLYNNNLKNFIESLMELKTVLGTQLLPQMTAFVQNAAESAIWFKNMAKAHPAIVTGGFELLKWVAYMKIATGALNIFTLGLPKLISGMLMNNLAANLVTMAATDGLVVALGGLLVASIGMISIGTIAVALGAVLLDAMGVIDIGGRRKAWADEASAQIKFDKAQAITRGLGRLQGPFDAAHPAYLAPTHGVGGVFGGPYASQPAYHAPMRAVQKGRNSFDMLAPAQRLRNLVWQACKDTGDQIAKAASHFWRTVTKAAHSLGDWLDKGLDRAGKAADRFGQNFSNGLASVWKRILDWFMNIKMPSLPTFGGSLWPGFGGGGGAGANTNGIFPGAGTKQQHGLPNPDFNHRSLTHKQASVHTVNINIALKGSTGNKDMDNQMIGSIVKEVQRVIPATGINMRNPRTSIHQQGLA